MSLPNNNNRQHSPFKVPDGYFESLDGRIMKQIEASEAPVHKRRSTTVRPLWRVLPLVGVAATIALAFVIAGLHSDEMNTVSQNPVNEVKITQDLSDKNIESVYDYLVLDNEIIYDYATE